jgi:hypothetical protein
MEIITIMIIINVCYFVLEDLYQATLSGPACHTEWTGLPHWVSGLACLTNWTGLPHWSGGCVPHATPSIRT